MSTGKKRAGVSIGAAIFSILFALVFNWRVTGDPLRSTTVTLAVTILAQILVGLAVGRRFFARFDTMPPERIRRSIAAGFVLFLVIILLICLLIAAASLYIDLIITGTDTSRFFDILFGNAYPTAIKYYLVFALLASSFFFHNIWRRTSEKEQKLLEENLRYRYRDLKAQVDSQVYDSLSRQSRQGCKERFLVKVGDRYTSVQTSDILYFYICERAVFLVTGSGKTYPVDYSLDKIEQTVNPGLFFRINRNFIVNYYAIRDMIAWSSNRIKIVLANYNEKEEVLVSRERLPEFKKWMDR